MVRGSKLMYALLVCPFLFKDVKEAVKLLGYTDLSVFAFKPKCYGKKHTKGQLFLSIPNSYEPKNIIVMGGYCIDTTTIPKDCHIQTQKICFSSLTNSNIIDNYILEGNYIVTSGWLATWKTRLQDMGFDHKKDRENSQLFFSEMTNKLLYLDSGTNNLGKQQLKEFADFIKLPYDTLNIGLDVLKLNIERNYLISKNINEKRDSKKKLNDCTKKNADFTLIMDVFSDIAESDSEEIVTSRIMELLNILYAPKIIAFVMTLENEKKVICSQTAAQCDSTEIIRQVNNLSEEYSWTESGLGFILRIKYHNKNIGYLFIDDIFFPEYKEEYLNLTISLTKTFGLAINNVRNISEIISQRNRLSQTLSKLKITQNKLVQTRKMESIVQLTGGIAHNFNNAICGIKGGAQLLEMKKSSLGEQEARYLDLILKSTDTASTLVQKLLEFSKTNNSLHLNLDLHNYLNDFLGTLKGLIGDRITIDLKLEAERHNILCDKSEIENVLINICMNASHAIDNIGHIKISTQNVSFDQEYCKTSSFNIKPGGFCRICIKDNGSGMTEKNINKIFDPFFTTKDPDKGTGLGLSAVHGIVVNHSGEIIVNSEFGSGSSFYISLPSN